MFLGPISGVPMLKVIVCVPAWAFASMIACRSEPAPESLMFVTSKPEPPPTRGHDDALRELRRLAVEAHGRRDERARRGAQHSGVAEAEAAGVHGGAGLRAEERLALPVVVRRTGVAGRAAIDVDPIVARAGIGADGALEIEQAARRDARSSGPGS